jgi:hypothetical protein
MRLSQAERLRDAGLARFVNDRQIEFIHAGRTRELTEAELRLRYGKFGYDRIDRIMRPDELSGIPVVQPIRLLMLRTRRSIPIQ